MRRKQIFLTALFIVYIVFLIWAIMFKFSFSYAEIPFKRRFLNLKPFGYYFSFSSYTILREIVLNFIIFLPFGGYLYMTGKMRFLHSLLTVGAASLLFEVLQYVFALGTSDITDTIMNTAGGITGYLMTFCFAKITHDEEKTEILFLILAGAVTTGVLVWVMMMKMNGLILF